jgi:hypothetical protein
MIGFIGMEIGKWSFMFGMRRCMIGRQLKSEYRDLNSDNTDLIIRLFFGDVGHCFIDFLENEVDLFHDSVIKRLHEFINGFITGVVHFDFFRVPFDLLKNIATDVGVAVLETVVDHVHEFDVLADFLELFVQVLLQNRNYVLEVGVEDILV